MFGGDGWAYDIGYGGLGPRTSISGRRKRPGCRYRSLLQYRRSGFQGYTDRCSCYSLLLPVRRQRRKTLGMMAMQLMVTVYVAQVAMGANHAPAASKLLKEAEAYQWSIPDHRLRSMYQPWYQGRYEGCSEQELKKL